MTSASYVEFDRCGITFMPLSASSFCACQFHRLLLPSLRQKPRFSRPVFPNFKFKLYSSGSEAFSEYRYVTAVAGAELDCIAEPESIGGNGRKQIGGGDSF